MTTRAVLFSLLILFFAAASLASAAESQFEVKNKITLGGDGFWDYLTADSQSRRLYIGRDNRIMIVDMDSQKLIAEIDGMMGVHGVAVVPEYNRGFISCGRENAVRIFDLKTLEKTGRVSTGKNPDAILYDPASKKIFAFNNEGTTATVIDPSSCKIVSQLQIGGAPEFAVADGNGKIYVNLEDKSEIAVIDSKALKTVAHWSLAPGEQPTGLALDLEHHRLFSGCRNKLMAILDSDSGKLITTLPIGAGVDGTAFDPVTHNAFSSNGRDGTITVIYEEDPNTFSVTQNLSTQVSARTITYDAKKHEIWVVGATPQEEPAQGSSQSPHHRRNYLPESFSALVIGKHIPVDEGVPFNRKHAAFDKNIKFYFLTRAAQNLPPIRLNNNLSR